MSDLELRIKSVEIASGARVEAGELVALSEAIFQFLKQRPDIR